MHLGVPSTRLPGHTLLGRTHQVIHLLTGAEKQVQLSTLIFPLLAGIVPAASQSAPSPGALLLLVSLGLVVPSGLRDTQRGSR